MPVLFVGRTPGVPPTPDFKDAVLLAEGFEDHEGPETITSDLCAWLLVFGCHHDDLDLARQTVSKRWLGMSGQPVELEVVVTDVSLLQRHARRGFRDFAPGEVWINGRPVMIRASSRAAHDLGVELVRKSVLRQRWQFWR